MNREFLPGITSISSNALLLSGTVNVLEQVELLPEGATGALTFGQDGVILVENKRVCWAATTEMGKRLTDILCEQKEPRLPREDIEAVYRRCKAEGKPVGEALVESGMISQQELRSALERHTLEAIIRLVQRSPAKQAHFARHVKHGYDPRFVFTTTELLASLDGQRRVKLAEQARQELAKYALPDIAACAFVRDGRSKTPVLVAVSHHCDLTVQEVLEAATWSVSALDVASFAEPHTELVAASWSSRVMLVTWRTEHISYFALCTTRAASAVLLSRLMTVRPSPVTERGSA